MLYGEYLRKRAIGRSAPEKMGLLVGGSIAPPDNRTGITNNQEAAADQSLKQVEELSFGQAGAIGAAQTLALLPGISRSGVTMVGGLLAGLTHEAAARFSFMLATPVIGLAALLKVPDLFKPQARDMLGMTVVAAILAGGTAYVSVRFLMGYFETKRLSPFGYYCVTFGLIALVVLQLRG